MWNKKRLLPLLLAFLMLAGCGESAGTAGSPAGTPDAGYTETAGRPSDSADPGSLPSGGEENTQPSPEADAPSQPVSGSQASGEAEPSDEPSDVPSNEPTQPAQPSEEPTQSDEPTQEPTPSQEPVQTTQPSEEPTQSAQPSQSAQPEDTGDAGAVYTDQVTLEDVDIADEGVALMSSSSVVAVHDLLMPVASGTAVKQNDKAIIDYSNITDGYVMVKFTASTDKRLKARVAGPTTTYTYNINPGEWVTFPLSDNNGEYKVTVFENTTGTKYATILSETFQVALKDEFAPFIRPNQYVDYSAASNAVAKAAELCAGITDPLKKVEMVYSFVVNNLTYDKDKAATVTSGYLPVLDSVLAAKKGICFDYASLMTGMLRSQNVPCKLVVGYAGQAYHAWISVWTAQTGWVEGVIYFDGTTWQRMDPTFASSGGSSESIMQYIGDGTNYTVKYLY